MNQNEVIKKFDSDRVIYTDDGLKTTIGECENTPDYHSSWICLMSVVEKLESLGCDVEIKSKYHPYTKTSSYHTVISTSDYSSVSSSGCGGTNYRFVSGNGETRIESVYNAVVNAIENLKGVKNE